MPKLPPPRPRLPGTLRARGTRACARPNCQREIVVTLNWDGIVLSFCPPHAEDKAGQEASKVLWLAASWGVCPRCSRLLPALLVPGDHFTATGDACPIQRP